VNYLSQTYEGKRHETKMADEANPTDPEDIGVYELSALRADYSSGLTYSMVYPLHPGHPTLGIHPG